MNIALWIVQGLLAVAFLLAGLLRITKNREEIKERAGERMAWVDDFSEGQLRAIGALEVLGAVGLILPAITGVLPVLTALAAAGLVLTMIGAAATHVRRGEMSHLPVNTVLGLLALFVAYGRFVVAPLA